MSSLAELFEQVLIGGLVLEQVSDTQYHFEDYDAEIVKTKDPEAHEVWQVNVDGTVLFACGSFDEISAYVSGRFDDDYNLVMGN